MANCYLCRRQTPGDACHLCVAETRARQSTRAVMGPVSEDSCELVSSRTFTYRSMQMTLTYSFFPTMRLARMRGRIVGSRNGTEAGSDPCKSLR